MDVQASIKRLRDRLGLPAALTLTFQLRQDVIDLCNAYDGEDAQVRRLAARVAELETTNRVQRDDLRYNEAAMRDTYARLTHAEKECNRLDRELTASRASKTALCGAHLDNVWCELPAGHDGAHWGAATKIWDQEPVRTPVSIVAMAKACEAKDAAQQAAPARCDATAPGLVGIHCDCPAGHSGPHYANTSLVDGISWDQEPVRTVGVMSKGEPADQWNKADTAPRSVLVGDCPFKRHDLKADTVTGWSSCPDCQMTTCNPALHINQPCPGVKR
jgi:hypothetical protein